MYLLISTTFSLSSLEQGPMKVCDLKSTFDTSLLERRYFMKYTLNKNNTLLIEKRFL